MDRQQADRPGNTAQGMGSAGDLELGQGRHQHGADGDVEYTAETTLTDWAAGLTAGRMLKIRLARDGDDGTKDASTVISYPLTLTLKYGYVN